MKKFTLAILSFFLLWSCSEDDTISTKAPDVGISYQINEEKFQTMMDYTYSDFSSTGFNAYQVINGNTQSGIPEIANNVVKIGLQYKNGEDRPEDFIGVTLTQNNTNSALPLPTIDIKANTEDGIFKMEFQQLSFTITGVSNNRMSAIFSGKGYNQYGTDEELVTISNGKIHGVLVNY